MDIVLGSLVFFGLAMLALGALLIGHAVVGFWARPRTRSGKLRRRHSGQAVRPGA